jgi:hypothetical protein
MAVLTPVKKYRVIFFSFQKHNKCKQTKQLIPGIVTAISG